MIIDFNTNINKLLGIKAFKGQILLLYKNGHYRLVEGVCPPCSIRAHLHQIQSYALLPYKPSNETPKEDADLPNTELNSPNAPNDKGSSDCLLHIPVARPLDGSSI